MNITITRPDNFGDLRFYVRDVPLPLVSTINFGSGQTRANSAVVHLGSEGEIVVRSDQTAGTVHLILDVTGYFE